MRTIISAAFFVAFAAITAYTITGPAMAGWTCQNFGNRVFCHNRQTNQSYTCFQLGNQTICN